MTSNFNALSVQNRAILLINKSQSFTQNLMFKKKTFQMLKTKFLKMNMIRNQMIQNQMTILRQKKSSCRSQMQWRQMFHYLYQLFHRFLFFSRFVSSTISKRRNLRQRNSTTISYDKIVNFWNKRIDESYKNFENERRTKDSNLLNKDVNTKTTRNEKKQNTNFNHLFKMFDFSFFFHSFSFFSQHIHCCDLLFVDILIS